MKTEAISLNVLTRVTARRGAWCRKRIRLCVAALEARMQKNMTPAAMAPNSAYRSGLRAPRGLLASCRR